MAIQSPEQPAFAPLHTPQRYERIAERLADEIRTGLLRPGARLPSERELARHLGVGRSSVREAIAVLGLRGVLETRPGSGSFVASDAPERLRAAGIADDAAEPPDADASPSALLEARTAIEPRIAALAAERGVPDPLAEALLAAMEDEPDRSAWNDADRRFHLQLAAMTRNPILTRIAADIAGLMDQPLWQRLRDESVAEPGRMALHAAEHRMIYEAVVAREPDAAAFYATQHIARVRRYMTLDEPPAPAPAPPTT